MSNANRRPQQSYPRHVRLKRAAARVALAAFSALACSCMHADDAGSDRWLIRDRILRLYGTEEGRAGAAHQLAAIGEPAVPALIDVMQTCVRLPDDEEAEFVYNAALTAFARIRGLRAAMQACLDNSLRLRSTTLKTLADEAAAAMEPERRQAAEILEAELAKPVTPRAVVSLQMAGAALEREVSLVRVVARFREAVRAGPHQGMACEAALSLDAARPRLDPEMVTLFGDMLKIESRMGPTLYYIADTYSFYDNSRGRRNRRSFVPILRELFVAYVGARDHLPSVDPGLLKSHDLVEVIEEEVRDRWTQVDPAAIVVDRAVPASARANLVECLASALEGRPEGSRKRFRASHFDPVKAKSAIEKAARETNDPVVIQSIRRWFPEIKLDRP